MKVKDEGKFSQDLVNEISPPWGKTQQLWGQGGLPPASCLSEGVEPRPISSWKKLWEEHQLAKCCSHVQDMLRGVQRCRTAALVVCPLQSGFPLRGGHWLLLQPPDHFRVCLLFPAKPVPTIVGSFYRLEWNEALCHPIFDDHMALLFPTLHQSLEEFPEQPQLFSAPSSLASVLGQQLTPSFWMVWLCELIALPEEKLISSNSLFSFATDSLCKILVRVLYPEPLPSCGRALPGRLFPSCPYKCFEPLPREEGTSINSEVASGTQDELGCSSVAFHISLQVTWVGNLLQSR